MPNPTSPRESEQPDTIATPEGDNEYAPDQPLAPDPPAITRPRGDEPHPSLPLRDALDG